MSSFTKTVTEKQLEANRLNAEHSTGPITPEGKAKVSQNRISHGLCGRFRVLPCESQEQFDALVTALIEAEQPANAAEHELVVKMAQHSWRASRALRLQDACFEMEELDEEEEAEGLRGINVNPINLQTSMRYHTLHDRAYQRAAKELMERRKQRQLAEIGFERKQAAEAQAKLKEEEAQRKSEKHKLAQEVVGLKKQLLEIRVAKGLIAQLRQTVPSQPDDEQEFAITQVQSAA